MKQKLRLLFVSPRFLFPIDSGGKIRTTGILRELKGGPFEITLVSPTPENPSLDSHMASVADRWHYWQNNSSIALSVKRYSSIFGKLPIPVASDINSSASKLIEEKILDGTDLVVFDFLHSTVLAPKKLTTPSVVFTHNIEAEIFKRHISRAKNVFMRWLWTNQWKKMIAFEKKALSEFDKTIAVSERDKLGFEQDYAISNIGTIPTGVDLSFFEYNYTHNPSEVIFTGSMDWLANQDGISFFLEDVWPELTALNPNAHMNVVGRSPPDSLINRASEMNLNWNFSGFVDDVRPYIHSAGVYVIPLRIGGGTRLKAFEAMASGCPIVSTAIGVEGLGLKDGLHYINAETPQEFADAISELQQNKEKALKISRAAREFVVENASNTIVAKHFEAICMDTINGR